MIKNINLEIAFDEVKGKSTNELRQTQTDIFASVYSLQKQCLKWLANAKPQIIDIMKNDQNTDVNSFVSATDELLLNVINKTPRLSTKLVREVIIPKDYLRCLAIGKTKEGWQKKDNLQWFQVDDFVIKDKQITLIPKSYQFNKGGKNE